MLSEEISRIAFSEPEEVLAMLSEQLQQNKFQQCSASCCSPLTAEENPEEVAISLKSAPRNAVLRLTVTFLRVSCMG